MDWITQLGETLARDHGAVAVILYGSRARGNERPESDVDLVVLVPDGASLAVTRDARTVLDPAGRTVDVDAWIYKLADVVDPARDPGLLRLCGGRALVDPQGLVPAILERIDALAAREPDPIPADELRALQVWAARMLRRAGATEAGPIASWRRAELLVQLLPDAFRLRRWWYPGPEPALRHLAAHAPALYAAYVTALAPGASQHDLEVLARLVFDVTEQSEP